LTSYIDYLQQQCENTDEESLVLDQAALMRMLVESEVYRQSAAERDEERNLLRDCLTLASTNPSIGSSEINYDDLLEEADE